MRAETRRAILLGLVIAATTTVAYLPAMRGDFIWDDDTHISANKTLAQPDAVRLIWSKPGATCQYYPLTFTAFWAGYRLWGLDPTGYHILNLIWHIITALLLWRLLYVLKVPGAWLGAAIFALHPVNVMSVAWMTELKNTLSTALLLACGIAYIRFAELGIYAPPEPQPRPATKPPPSPPAADARPTFWILAGTWLLTGINLAAALVMLGVALVYEKPGQTVGWPPFPTFLDSYVGAMLLATVFTVILALRVLWRRGSRPSDRRWAWHGLALVCFVFAMFAKTAVSLAPISLLLILWWQRGRLRWRDLAPLGPLAAIAAGMGQVTIYVEKFLGGAIGSVYNLDALQRILVSGRSFWFYLVKLILPLDLTFIYPRWNVAHPAWWFYLFPPATVAALVALYVWRGRLGRGLFAAAVHFYMGTCFLILMVVIFMTRFSFVSDHWQYLGCISIMAVFGAGITLGLKRLGLWDQPAGRLAVALLLGVLALLTWRQARIYKNLDTLWSDTLVKNPDSSIAHNNYGVQLFRADRMDEALHQFTAALHCDPHNDAAMENIASIYMRKGLWQKALDYITQAILANNYVVTRQTAMAQCLSRLGQTAKALPYYRNAIRLSPDKPQVYNDYGLALLDLKEPDKALAQFAIARRLNPSLPETYVDLSMVAESRHQYPRALDWCAKALALGPGKPYAEYQMGNLLMETGQPAQAVSHYTRAIAGQVDFAEAYNGLGSALLKLGQPAQAVPRLETALKLNPSLYAAHKNLGSAYGLLGRTSEAIAQFESCIHDHPNDAEAHQNLGAQYLLAGHTKSAEVQLRQALALQPDYFDAHLNLAQTLGELGQTKAAIQEYQAALKLQPDQPTAHFLLGRALAALGRPADAVPHLEKALALQPHWLDALDALADAYARLGDFAKAISVGRQALALVQTSRQQALIRAWTTRLSHYEAGQPR